MMNLYGMGWVSQNQEALLRPMTFDTNQTTCWIPNLVGCSAAETFDARAVLVVSPCRKVKRWSPVYCRSEVSLSHHHIYNQHYNHHEPERRPSCCASASIAKARGEEVSAGRSMVKAICVTTTTLVASWKGDTKSRKMLICQNMCM